MVTPRDQYTLLKFYFSTNNDIGFTEIAFGKPFFIHIFIEQNVLKSNKNTPKRIPPGVFYGDIVFCYFIIDKTLNKLSQM
ncbi:hypothetical protein GCM10027284_16570 [Cyclobacterium sediminis]